MSRVLLGLFLGLLLLNGCGGGETLPLVSPSGVHEFGVDPSWRLQPSILEGAYVESAVWPANGRPVVVGTDGLIAENEERGRWHREDSGLQYDFTKVAADGAGGLLATSSRGAALRQPDGSWQTVTGLPRHSWIHLSQGDGAYWLTGYEGLLYRVSAEAEAEEVPVPGESTLLTVLAESDSLFVAGRDGFCQVRVDGVWSELALPLAADSDVEDLFRLEDGRLLLVADENGGTVYVREATGWVAHPEIQLGGNYYDFWYEDGYFWAIGSSLMRWDPSTEPWTSQEYPGFRHYYSRPAFGPAGEVFQSLTGLFQWHIPGNGGELTVETDASAAPRFNGLYRLNDGTVVGRKEEQIYEITPSGPQRFYAQDLGDSYSDIAGSSLQDLYFLSGGELHHLTGGQTEIIPLPSDIGYMRYLAVNDAGQFLLTGSDGCCAWDGASWEFLPLEPFNSGRPHATKEQTLVACSNQIGVYLGPDGLVPFPLELQGYGVTEPEPGWLMVHSRYFQRYLYQMGTGAHQLLVSDPLPDWDSIRGTEFVATDTGGLVLTSDFGMVLGVTVSGTRADWELVAGPWSDHIEFLQVLADGSLAALDDLYGRLLLHPAPGN